MDFDELYNKFHNMLVGCDLTKKFNLKKIMIGSGGSQTIIVEISDKNNHSFVIKMFPDLIFQNVKVKPNYDKLEILFYKFFTSKYVLTDRTPHFVGLYSHQKCDHVDKFIKSLLPEKSKCLSYGDRLLNKIKLTDAKLRLCELLDKHKYKLINPNYELVVLERCEYNMDDYIGNFFKKIVKNPKSIKNNIMTLWFQLYRLLFQIIFTLAIVKDDYPGFQHGDLFMRNILIKFEDKYDDSDYVVYYYKQKKFYLPANGTYVKISDFNLTVIKNELENNFYKTNKFNKSNNKFRNYDPLNQKNDIFNLLHNLYSGDSYSSISNLVDFYKISKKNIEPLYVILNNFIDLDIVDRINKDNKDLLDGTWNIDGIEILENSVRTPHEYLKSNIFEIFYKFRVGDKHPQIIKEYNKP